jgi:hypothetical protein
MDNEFDDDNGPLNRSMWSNASVAVDLAAITAWVKGGRGWVASGSNGRTGKS